jgi:hypothetical protein
MGPSTGEQQMQEINYFRKSDFEKSIEHTQEFLILVWRDIMSLELPTHTKHLTPFMPLTSIILVSLFVFACFCFQDEAGAFRGQKKKAVTSALHRIEASEAATKDIEDGVSGIEVQRVSFISGNNLCLNILICTRHVETFQGLSDSSFCPKK